MSFIDGILILAAIAGLLLLRSARRKRAAPTAGTAAPTFSERHEARRKIVEEAARLRELEDALMRFSEGSDPAISAEECERRRREAASLRRRLETECIRRGLPIALVRRGRSATINPIVRTPGIG